MFSRHQFKALPLDTKIFTRQLCAKRIKSRPKTVCEPFDLAPDKRMNASSASSSLEDISEETAALQFHANPFPKSIFEAAPVRIQLFFLSLK